MNLKKHNFVFLGVTLLVSFILRFPSLFEPNWYGDEGIYQIIGKIIRAGGLLYRDAWDNKPPLLYLIYASFDGDHFWARLLSLLFLLISIVVFWLLTKKLFTKNSSIFVSTGLFALLFSTPIFEGNIANAENFMLLPIIAAGLLVFNYTLYPKRSILIWAGFLLSLAFLTKIVAIFDLVSFLVFLAFLKKWEKKDVNFQIINKFVTSFTTSVIKFLREIKALLIGFILPIALTVLYFVLYGLGSDFLTSTFSQNVGYVNVGNQLLSPFGLLIIKLALLAVYLAFLFRYRHLLSKTQIFILVWLGLSVFNAFFAGRPYTHYLLVLLPSFSLLIGEIVEGKKHRLIYTAFTILLVIFLARNFWIYGKTFFYYQNFVSFVTSQKSVLAYQDFFAPHVRRDYMLAQFLRGKTSPKDEIFIWGDNAQIYTLSGKLPPGRFTVAYHITFYQDAFSETQKVLATKKPKYIVVIKEISPFEELLKGYKLAYIIEGAKIYGRFNLP